jgi:hypothetical protein
MGVQTRAPLDQHLHDNTSSAQSAQGGFQDQDTETRARCNDEANAGVAALAIVADRQVRERAQLASPARCSGVMAVLSGRFAGTTLRAESWVRG